MTSLNIIQSLPLLRVCWFSWFIPTFISFSLQVQASCKLLHCPSVDDYGAAENCKRKKKREREKKVKITKENQTVHSTQIDLQCYWNREMEVGTHVAKQRHQAHAHAEIHTHKSHCSMCVSFIYIYIFIHYINRHIHTRMGQFSKCHQVCRKRGKSACLPSLYWEHRWDWWVASVYDIGYSRWKMRVCRGVPPIHCHWFTHTNTHAHGQTRTYPQWVSLLCQ